MLHGGVHVFRLLKCLNSNVADFLTYISGFSQTDVSGNSNYFTSLLLCMNLCDVNRAKTYNY